MELSALKNLIANTAIDMSASELAEILNAKTVEVRDDALYTWAGVALTIGPTNAEYLRLALEANGVGWAVHQLGGSGIQISLALTQGMLQQFAQAGVPGCDDLALAGIHNISPYVNAGGIGEVNDTDIQTALDALLLDTQKAELINAGASAWNSFVAAVGSWDGSTAAPVLGS